MDNEERLNALRKFFTADRYVALSGIEIDEVTDEYAQVRAKILPCHLNAGGAVQGGMLFTAADFAFAVLCNDKHPVTVTHSANISYIRAAKTESITARAVEITRTGHNCVVEVTVKDAEGNIVCVCCMNGFISERK